MPTDPVCGMFVDAGPDALQLTRESRTYYFCSQTCVRTFAEPEHERARLLRRLALAWPLSVVLVVLTYVLSFPHATIVAATLAAVVQFYPGWVFYRGTYDAVRNRIANMDVLIAVGTSAAFLYSLFVVLLPGRLPPATYFDASALIITLILTGNYIEHLTRVRAGSALRRLDELLPEQAEVVRGGVVLSIPPSEIRPGDLMRVFPGGKFAADGVVRSGRTSADESLLTGESLPVSKGHGDRVLAGAINGEGAVEVEATGVGSDTFVAQVGRLLTDAEMSRVPLQRTADRIAAVFVPLVLALAVLSAVAWYFLGGAGFTIALLIFVTVAITACPCAFGIATPAAIVVGTGRAAEAGVLFRGEDAIERAARVDVVLTDKTGTLTRGSPVLIELRSRSGVPGEHALSLAAAVEAGSTHPYARAVGDAAKVRGLTVPRSTDVTVDPGRGVRGKVDGTDVEVVRPDTDAPSSVSSGPLDAEVRRLTTEGNSVAMVKENGVVIAVMAFRDPIADEVPEALKALAEDQVDVVMVTGDHVSAARRVAGELGIREVHAGLTPVQKIELLRRFQSEGRVVAYVGDGINDAPALAGADLGMAIGAGAAVAREAGQVLLVRSDFRGVAFALRIARRTVAKVRANLAWAIGYNAVLLPIAMGALVPLFGLSVYQVLPVAGAVAMGLSSTTVVLNSLSLRWVKVGRSVRPAPTRATPMH
ncbi:MAG TPA: heavy metal translocating P-type ATPase [Thermoplasmata archaeon]|jgi:heavy metal translocating P-type ATPase